MWLNNLENSTIELLFRTNLAQWLNVMRNTALNADLKTLKKTEQENEDKATNVSIVIMFGLVKVGESDVSIR